MKYTKKHYIECTKGQQNIPNSRKIGPPKFTEMRIFGLKINHLATLCRRRILSGTPKIFVRKPKPRST
jgi:hypothetical protein